MKEQDWIFSVTVSSENCQRPRRCAVVGPARASTVEAALHLTGLPEAERAQIRAYPLVRRFVEGQLDPDLGGYSHSMYGDDFRACIVCVGSVQEVLSR